MPINLGQITFGIGADTTRLGRSINDITRFGTAVTAAAQNAATAGTAVEASLRRQEAAMISALQKVQRYQDAVSRLEAPTRLTQGLNQLSTRGLDLLVQRMSSGRLTALQFQREMERFNTTLNNSQRIMTNWAEAQKRADANAMVANLQKLSSAAILVAGPLSGIATRISVIAGLAEHFSLAWAGAISGIAAGAYAFYKLSTSIVQTEKQLQSISATLMAVYGNTTIANLQLSYLRDLADRSGLAINILGKQFAQFEAAAKGTSIEGERTRTVFEAVVFAAQKLGLGIEETEGALRAIQQMVSKGTIQMEELKGQLGDRLPGAIQIMAKALDVTVPKLNEIIKKGELGASVLPKFAEALKLRYNIDTAQKIDTITASEGRLNTARIVMLDTLDRLLGISTAYKNTLEFITNAMNGVTNNSRELVSQFLRVGAALAAAFAGPMILAGLSAMTNGVIGLARAIATVNAASALGALTSFARVLAILAVAVGAYYGSGQLIDKALAANTDSFLKAKPAVEDYIKAQQTLVTSVRAPTQEYIKQQEELRKAQEAERDKLEKQIVALETWGKTLTETGMSAEQVAQQLRDMGATDTLIKKYDAAAAAVQKTKQSIADLYVILAKQTEEENRNRSDPAKELNNRQKTTMDKAEESIRNLKEKYNNLFLAPAQKEFQNTQEEINHAIVTFKENLERAEVPADKVAKLVKDYGAAFRAFKEGELSLKSYVSSFQLLSDVAKKAADTLATNLVDAIVDGKDAMTALQDTARTVVKYILNEFLKLAVIGPLMNSLFGTNQSVLGGNAGIGGLLGNIFSGSAQSMANPYVTMPMAGVSFAMGGIMTERGPLPLKKYAGGGVASSPQLAMFGEGSQSEAFVPLPDGRRIPVNLMGGGGSSEGPKTIVNVINESKEVKATYKNRQSGGADIHDIIIQTVSQGFINDEFSGLGGRGVKRR